MVELPRPVNRHGWPELGLSPSIHKYVASSTPQLNDNVFKTHTQQTTHPRSFALTPGEPPPIQRDTSSRTYGLT